MFRLLLVLVFACRETTTRDRAMPSVRSPTRIATIVDDASLDAATTCTEPLQFGDSPRFCLVLPAGYRATEPQTMGNNGGYIWFYYNGDAISESVFVRWYHKRKGFSFKSLNRPMSDVLWEDVKPGRSRYRLQNDRTMDVMGYLQLDAREHVIECQTSSGETGAREDLARVMMCDSLVVLD